MVDQEMVLADLAKLLENSTVNLSRKTSKNRRVFIDAVVDCAKRLVTDDKAPQRGDDRIVRLTGKIPTIQLNKPVVLTKEMSEYKG